jgi:hypothetical protein
MERRTTMAKNVFSFAGVAGLFMAVALLTGCYAPLANQDGYFNLNLGGTRLTGTSQVIVLVVNSDSGDTFKETLNLISKAYHAGGNLSSTDTDRLTTLAKSLATTGLVRFGGFPFYQTSMSGTSGSFKIPGVPADRDYFVKLLVFQPGFSFKVENIGADLGSLIQAENLVFNTETYTTPTAWQGWTPVAGQPVSVKPGQSATLSVALTTTIP